MEPVWSVLAMAEDGATKLQHRFVGETTALSVFRLRHHGNSEDREEGFGYSNSHPRNVGALPQQGSPQLLTCITLLLIEAEGVQLWRWCSKAKRLLFFEVDADDRQEAQLIGMELPPLLN
jgi:hypothetical protein